MMETDTTPAVHDLVTGTGDRVRIDYITTGGDEVYVVHPCGGRWSIPVEYLVLDRPGVRGGSPAEWTVSPEWTS